MGLKKYNLGEPIELSEEGTSEDLYSIENPLLVNQPTDDEKVEEVDNIKMKADEQQQLWDGM